MARITKTFFLIVALSFLTAACGGGAAGGGVNDGAASDGSSGSGSSTVATGVYVLSWDAVTDPAVTGYRVYYAIRPLSDGNILGTIDTTSTSLELATADYGLATGTTLYVAVSALGTNSLESPVSNEVTAVLE